MNELPERFEPDRIEAFRYVRWRSDVISSPSLLRAELTYALDDLELTEVFEIPMPPAVDERRLAEARAVLAQLFLAAGVSYYKCAAPPVVRIEHAAVDAADVRFVEQLFAKGLGEFAFHNGLEAELRPRFDFTPTSVPRQSFGNTAGGSSAAPRPLVPVGGGKDSCVTVEALRRAGLAPTLVTVNRYPVIQRVIDASGLPDIAITRKLDPRLSELNARGARNGHVPITAIVSLACAAAAALWGFDAVVMSDERSASEGNVIYRGVEINHQWSKSADAELSIAAAIARSAPSVAYFSLLRPLSELAIVDAFARTCRRYFDVFSSCNAAFRIDAARRTERWCGHCPKCQFVFLALATVLSPPSIEAVFGSDVFASSPTEGFLALLGLGDWKPFECVGESLECRVALRLLTEQNEWRDHPTVRALAAAVPQHRWPTDDDVRAVYGPDRSPSPAEALVPDRYRAVQAALGSGVGARA